MPKAARLLDVGCGGGSPEFVKSIRPDVYYVGLDVGDYRQTEATKGRADEYVITTPEAFADKIVELGAQPFDVVISAHNLEHCNEPKKVLEALCHVLRPGGQLYLSFPAEASVRMPSRKGTLNFYDDPTHREVPVWRDVLQVLSDNGMEFAYTAARYRPLGAFLIGLVLEPFVAPFKRQAPKAATWALYGFESVIWAVKRNR